jgi:hypothetical protein
MRGGCPGCSQGKKRVGEVETAGIAGQGLDSLAEVTVGSVKVEVKRSLSV